MRRWRGYTIFFPLTILSYNSAIRTSPLIGIAYKPRPDGRSGLFDACTRNLRSDRARLQLRRNNPFLLRPRPYSAPLHRCEQL